MLSEKKKSTQRLVIVTMLALLLTSVTCANKWNRAGTQIRMLVSGKVLSKVAIAQSKITALTIDDKLVV